MFSKCKAMKKNSQLIEGQKREDFGNTVYGRIFKNHPALS